MAAGMLPFDRYSGPTASLGLLRLEAMRIEVIEVVGMYEYVWMYDKNGWSVMDL